jgi:hypothetical protein
MADETFEKTFAAPTPARLALGNIRGSVKIEPGADGEIAVRAIKQTDTGDARGTEVILEQADDGSVKVETRYRENGSWFLHRTPCKVDYTVRVPRLCSMSVSGVSNRAEIGGVEGDVKVSAVSGSVRVSDLKGPLKINTVSGRVEGERLVGDLTFETVSGGVSLVSCSLPSVSGSTVSGGVTVETPLGEGPYRFKSVSGGVTLRLPPDTACTVETDSLSGGLKTSLPKTNSQTARRHGPGGREVAELNGGGVRIQHHSVSGGLRLEPLGVSVAAARPAVEPEARAAASEARPHPSKLEILERIERGEITPEQAVELMKWV